MRSLRDGIYASAHGVRKGWQGARMVRKAAALGDTGAMYDIGALYENGEGVRRLCRGTLAYEELAARGFAPRWSVLARSMTTAKGAAKLCQGL